MSLESMSKKTGYLLMLLVFLLGLVFGAHSVHHPVSSSPKVIGKSVNPTHRQILSPALFNLKGQIATLAQGTQGTVVLAMAPWCSFCAYEDRWVLPQMVSANRVIAVDVVDVSYLGGIASPGPEYPPFHGLDAQGSTRTEASARAVMRQYIEHLHIVHTGLHFYVMAPQERAQWSHQPVPQWYVLNSKGALVAHYEGALTAQQATTWIEELLKP